MTREEAYLNIPWTYVHGIGCGDEPCENNCGGYESKPSFEEFAAIIESPPDAEPISGWRFSAARCLAMLGLTPDEAALLTHAQ